MRGGRIRVSIICCRCKLTMWREMRVKRCGSLLTACIRHVVAGAAGEDRGQRLWTLEDGSMSWAQFRFGEVPA